MTKILCVDDDSSLLLLYQEELSDDGYDVIVARNSGEALERYDAELPHLVILDIHMANMNGLKTLKALLERNKNLPVILNTAYSVDLRNILNCEAAGYVIKSSELSELKEKIKEVLDSKKSDK